ncbi:MAG: transglutaminase [Hirschia sp.]|nr:transglutaminase [Hirschia sp.]MBF17094.1 transglutaminase [Hirschia sp.]|tara:strand:+ start:704 stop:1480 length:777 start_codon:yes stop_codon:yes gene_type:complete
MRIQIQSQMSYFLPMPVDTLLVVEAGMTRDQKLETDLLTISGAGPLHPVKGEDGVGQRTWFQANGELDISYEAIVDVTRGQEDISSLQPTSRLLLPQLVIPYLFASRYCDSDRAQDFAFETFGQLQGGQQVLAICKWIQDNVTYMSGVSDSTTTASDTLNARQGVCRDFAHLFITLARACGVPARMVSVYAPDVQPQDFHAVAEVWLEGAWRMVDATGMATPDTMVKIAVGRDATDIAFMTTFGRAELKSQSVNVQRI